MSAQQRASVATMPRKRNLLTTAQAAELVGMTPAGFRSTVARARAVGGVELRLPKEEWLDGRTPLYDADKLTRYLESRPGMGRWGVRD